MQSLLLGRNAAGRAEARLRVRCGDAVVEARLSEDARGGVDWVITVDDDPALADRVAAALDQWAAGPGRDGRAGDGRPHDERESAPPTIDATLAPGAVAASSIGRVRVRYASPRPERVRPGVDYQR